jgi:hypothetical protein
MDIGAANETEPNKSHVQTGQKRTAPHKQDHSNNVVGVINSKG